MSNKIVIIAVVILILLYIKHVRGIKALPEHLKYKIHNDWVFPFCFIPRSLNAFNFRQPPKLLIGSKNLLDWTEKSYGKDLIRKKGLNPCQRHPSWYLAWPLYFTITWTNVRYLRLGFRWEDNNPGDYYNLGFICKKIDDGLHAKANSHGDKSIHEEFVVYKGIYREWECNG